MKKCVLCNRKVTQANPEMIRKDISICTNCSIPSSWIDAGWAKCNCPSCK